MTEDELFNALYLGATADSELYRALGMLSERFHCRATALLSLNSSNPAADVAISTGAFDEAARRRYAADFAALDPAPAAFARLSMGRASTTDRILSGHIHRKSPFLHEFFRPLGLTETLGGRLRTDTGRFELIGLQRGDDRARFDDAEIADLERVMPHISRALQIRRAFRGLQDKLLGLEAAVERLPAGVALLDGKSSALFVNHAMAAIASCDDGLVLDRKGSPIATASDARRRMAELVNDVTKGGAGGVFRVPRPSGLPSYAALVAPWPESGLPRAREGTRGVLVIIHDPAASQTLAPPDVLQAALGLPKGAAQLVAAMVADYDLKRFAEREGITIHTARFHLRTALQRTGTRNQADLVRLAVRLLRDFALRGDDQGR